MQIHPVRPCIQSGYRGVSLVKIVTWIIFVCFLTNWAAAKDLYVSTGGKGKIASKTQPAKDLGNILELLEPGDTVHIAAGTYLGKGSNGSDEITIPVSLIGGYDETFSTRDPWGKSRTIMSGDNLTKNYVNTARIFYNLAKWKTNGSYIINIDGLIIDDSGRNHYKTGEQLQIVRMASPKEGKNPTPESGGIVIWIPGTLTDEKAGFEVTVQNCVLTNTAPAQGVLTIRAGKNSKVTIKNNLIVNNTGIGIYLSTAFHGAEKLPRFTVENNTVLFTWKYDALASSYSGESLLADAGLEAVVLNNVLGIADRIGVTQKGKEKLLLKDNYIFGNLDADFYEAAADQKIMLDDIEDEATTLTPDSTGNVAGTITIPVNTAWTKNWSSRVLIDRNAKEADIKEKTGTVNAIRSMLGLPLQGEAVAGTGSAVWLHRMMLDDVLAAGNKAYNGKGCRLPAQDG